MTGTILENLSGRKLSVLVTLLLLSQVACFLLGGLLAPLPAGHQVILAMVCKDTPGRQNDTTFWLHLRGDGKCPAVSQEDIEQHYTKMANEIVYIFQMPLPRGEELDYSRWQQNLIGVLQVDIAYEPQVSLVEPPKDLQLTIDARLAYRNKGDKKRDWKLYAHSLEKRYLDCGIKTASQEESLYSCDMVPLFELGDLHHDYYLLNLRFPIDTDMKMNLDFGHMHDLTLTVIHQNGGFTKVWLSLKTVLFPFVVAIMIWFWRRVHILQRSPALLEYMLIYLGGALTFLNFPIEYLSLFIEMPYLLLLSDIRQGVFYAMLLSFWLVFAGEHMLIQESPYKSTIRSRYWKHLSAVVVGCLSLFTFDICERGVQMRNPFYSIWTTPIGARVAMGFIILAAISAGIYFLFLCYMVWKVFRNIGAKRTSLPSMSNARRLHYEGLIFRFKFLMLATLLCAGLTVAGFIIGQVAEGQWKWDEDMEIQLTSAFLTGVYGMWNIYIFALLILYAPSHKQWPSNNSDETTRSNENIVAAAASEEIEFSHLPSDSNPSEISSLTSFSRKVAFD
ncbi:PREDICTED: protein wntless isoform X2 [Rhagoletis zephyria]|uniref:protein wntless isoform X2 n=1 Tax=Rhagoletis zephyria TaxID=28612 RepID=UPI000811973C|nr:PREDICTED: protein wntless isoform X2 [Rhagoletis zephyria]